MRLVRDLAAVLAIMCVVLSCNLFSGDERAVSEGGDGNEATVPGESGGSKSETGDEDEAETEDGSPEPESDPMDKSTTVRFAKGKTSRSYTSSIKKGGSHTFRLAAAKGQDMDVEISSKQNNAEIRVFDPSGRPVANDGSPAIFSANLPSTGTYKIVVTSEKGDDSFTVDFIVAGGAEEPPDPPQQGGLTKTVKFSRGKSSASYSDAVLLGTRNNYILGAQAGQSMSVSISSVENNAVFQIRGPNGYLRGAGPGTDRRSWSGQLPANGKYTVIVGSTRGNATYSVTFSIR
ncbi:MAG: PPC domain-containing protein [Acidobacteriota bacterium]|nr:PPC domain-containing protein [Acidobacteriota bacterium]